MQISQFAVNVTVKKIMPYLDKEKRERERKKRKTVRLDEKFRENKYGSSVKSLKLYQLWIFILLMLNQK